MTPKQEFRLRLFYSYSHRDSKYRKKMEDSLTLLREQEGVLKEWSDTQILPGQHISDKIRENMNAADIFVFLVSTNFIASSECRREWQRAREIARTKPNVALIPVILRACQWQDLDGMSDIKALPEDGRPIRTFADTDVAWKQVYEGLRDVVTKYRAAFTLRSTYRREMEKTEFISNDHLRLQDLYIFPRLVAVVETSSHDSVEEVIDDEEALLRSKHALIHGDDLSGKTALCRHLFLTLVDQEKPVLYVNLATISGRVQERTFGDAYERSFHGDYALWRQQLHKIVIVDNLTRHGRSLEYVLEALKQFEHVIVTTSSHTFFAYYRDEERLAKFRHLEIRPLTHFQQETLIRRHLRTSDTGGAIQDGRIDQMENRVNSVILNNRILPRYPFYVLSILQTYEAFMPQGLSITAHGHCYYVLIIAHLIKSGISRADAEINSCLNFLEHVAFDVYQRAADVDYQGSRDLGAFVEEYKKNYLLKDSALNRLCDEEFGLIEEASGRFRSPYMYYYFLGRFLANHADEKRTIIDNMLQRSYVTSNCLALIFAIHHTSDSGIIEDIMLHNMCALDGVEPAVLDKVEVKIFEEIVEGIPREILSGHSVEAERERERKARDEAEETRNGEVDAEEEAPLNGEAVEVVNDVYRILKNNEILGQILKNKYGSLERNTIAAITENIADGGLRLIQLVLGRQGEMNSLAAFVHGRTPELGVDEVRRALRMASFLWTMGNVEMVVAALNKPELREVVDDVVAAKGTAAYELIGYFLRLDTVGEFSVEDVDALKSMLSKYRYPFLERVLSIRTQHYLGTHRVPVGVEQAACEALNIKYRRRLKKEN